MTVIEEINVALFNSITVCLAASDRDCLLGVLALLYFLTVSCLMLLSLVSKGWLLVMKIAVGLMLSLMVTTCRIA